MAPLAALPAAMLGAAGAGKLVSPAAAAAALRSAGLPAGPAFARTAGAVELTAGAAALVAPSRPSLLAVAAVYVVLAGVAVRLLRAGEAVTSCGCFGDAGPPTRLHVGVDVACAAVTAAAAVAPPPGLATLAAGAPLAGTGLAVGAAACVYALTLVLRLLPAAATAYRPGRRSA